MKNSKALFQDFINRITVKESQDEIQSVAYLVFENLFGFSRTEILAGKEITDESGVDKLDEIIHRINQYEPVQYVLGEASFYGRIFKVNAAVLIPRPETEELVRCVLNFVEQTGKTYSQIIDIGTGSGCIAITLSLQLRSVDVIATDVSDDALQLASHNALTMGAKVQFVKHDILKSKLPVLVDIMISNPPYIAWNERDAMSMNVVEYEPALALFVDSDDPLVFYKALIERANESLKPGGLLAVEINERYGKEVYQLFESHHFKEVHLLQDVFGKDRIVKGILSS